MKLAIVILAGGEGRRIGGGKPLRLLGGTRLIDRASALAAGWSDTLAVSVREEEQVGHMPLPCIFDEPGIEGPLSGLSAGLRFGADRGCDAVLTIPADMPFLPRDLDRGLAEQLGTAGAAIAGSGGHLHPVCGLWRISALGELGAYVASGRRSLKGFAEKIGCNAVWWPAEPVDPFFNINSPDDLAAAEQLLAG